MRRAVTENLQKPYPYDAWVIIPDDIRALSLAVA
jgi:hypothetical protein